MTKEAAVEFVAKMKQRGELAEKAAQAFMRSVERYVSRKLPFGTLMSPPAIEMCRELRKKKPRLVVTKVDRKRGRITLKAKP